MAAAPPPLPPHTPDPLPSPIPGEMTPSMKQTRFGCGPSRMMSLERSFSACTFACVRATEREWQRGRVCVSQWRLHVYGMSRVGRIKEGKERNKCRVSLFSWGDQLFNLQDWLNWGGEKWGGNVNCWQLCLCPHPPFPFFCYHSWSPEAIYHTVWTTNDHMMPLFTRLCIWDRLTEWIWSRAVSSYACACIFHGFLNFLLPKGEHLFSHLCFSVSLQNTFVK